MVTVRNEQRASWTKRRFEANPVHADGKKDFTVYDFEKAKRVNLNTVSTRLKRLFPDHHPHELRYTFITRCKECGVNPEVVMIWSGHSEDKDVLASRVNRGYTDFSEEFQLKEAEKVNY